MNDALPCGRTLSDVARHLSHLPDPHEIQCKWCTLAREELSSHEAAVRNAYANAADLSPSFFEAAGNAVRAAARTSKRYWVPGDAEGNPVEATSLELARIVRDEMSSCSGFAPIHVSVVPADDGDPHRAWHVDISIGLFPRSTWTRTFAAVAAAVDTLGRRVKAERVQWDLKVEDVFQNG